MITCFKHGPWSFVSGCRAISNPELGSSCFSNGLFMENVKKEMKLENPRGIHTQELSRFSHIKESAPKKRAQRKGQRFFWEVWHFSSTQNECCDSEDFTLWTERNNPLNITLEKGFETSFKHKNRLSSVSHFGFVWHQAILEEKRSVINQWTVETTLTCDRANEARPSIERLLLLLALWQKHKTKAKRLRHLVFPGCLQP